MAGHFGLSASVVDQPDPTRGRIPRSAAVVARLRRAGSGRRLAWLDNTFPWRYSGFRYNEALAMFELRPDTVFFSSYVLDDPFPAPVHRLSDFAHIATSEGITDVYGVFQLFLEGLVGLHDRRPKMEAFPGPDISEVLRRTGIRLHGTIYPGGGFVPNADGIARLVALRRRTTTLFSYVREALDVEGVVEIPQALTATVAYPPSLERWRRMTPFTCLFAADAPPRKGLDVALAAFEQLDPSRFHLHVVGPHQHRRPELPADLATFHGWLRPEQLASLHRDVHAFISPVRREEPGPPGSFIGATDGFPTQAAADAMSSGCLLISANPQEDHRVLQPGSHYVDCSADPSALRSAIMAASADPAAAQRTAEEGSRKVRDQMDIRRSAELKLRHMGLYPKDDRARVSSGRHPG